MFRVGPPRNRRPPARAARPLRGQETGELVQETGELVQETGELIKETGAEESVPEKSNIKAENKSKGTAKLNMLGMPTSLYHIDSACTYKKSDQFLRQGLL